MIARAFRVRCTDMDSADTYRFEVARVSRTMAQFRAYAESLPKDARVLTFAASCFGGGQGVLGMSQTNPVTHEPGGAPTLYDTTPPFFLSAEHARHAKAHGQIRGLRFFDFLGAMPVLTRAADVTCELSVFGKKRALVAESYRGPYSDEIAFVRGLDRFDDAAVILRLSRDDEFSVELFAIEG